MGLCGSTLSDEEKRALKISKQLEADNAKAFQIQSNKIRLLLLGAGESGKSTIFKQMRILYGSGFTQEDRHSFISSIHHNTITCMKVICGQVSEMGFEGKLVKQAEFRSLMDKVHDNDTLTEEIAGWIKALWKDPAVQLAWSRKSEYQVIESNAQYFSRLDAISAFGYVPPDEDILISRVRTTGIVEEAYEIDGVTFVIIDVGGQRNERKKWIHCFEDVNAIIYVAALSEYDQQLFEDSSQNRMVEALTLFGEMCNSLWFARTDMILFLNKCDLFAQKIKKVAINRIPEFENYNKAENDYDAGVQFFLEEFMRKNTCDKDIFFHVTCATDSSNVRIVFDACRDIILKKNLEDSGFMS